MLTSLVVKGLSSRLAGPISVCLLLAAAFLDLGQRLSLAAGTGAMAIAGFLWTRSRTSAVIVAFLGASILIYRGGISETADVWVRPLGLAVILLVGWSLTRYEEAGNRPSSVLLLALTLFAIWVNVPETRIARLFLGSWSGLLPGLAVAGLPKLGWCAPAIAGPIVWMTAVSGTGRPGSIIGGWASMGILLLKPWLSTKPWHTYLVHAGLVLVTSRVAGFRESPIEAAVISLTAFAIAGVLLWLMRLGADRVQSASQRGVAR